MRHSRATAIAVTALGLVAACAAAEPQPPASPSHAFSTRGPLAISIAAEPRATHLALETAWPLGRGFGTGAGAREGRGLRLDALLLSGRELTSDGRASSGLAATLLLERAAARTAGWFGLSAGGPRGDRLPVTRLRAAAGLAQALSAVQTEANVITSSVLYRNDPRWMTRRHWAYPVLGDSTQSQSWRDTSTTEPSDHSSLWTTLQGAVRWQRSRWALESVGGLSLGEGVGPRRWAQATVRAQLSRHVLALASFGERPAPSLAFDGAAQPHTMLGLQYAPWSTPEWAMVHALSERVDVWRTRSLDAGRSLVRVHCAGASRLEIAGDFTDWQALALLPVHAGWWSVVLPAEPGVHRVQVRVDGGPWQAPPGLPRADDGPAGPAGTLLVR
jgi:hypothetical protein